MRALKPYLALAALWLVAAHASATTDINGLYDARSHGMGGVGVAFVDSAGAIPINPALLDQVGKLTVSADLFGIVSQAQVPYTVYHQNDDGTAYKNYETVRSKPNAGVLPFLGLAVRLHERVVFGSGIYPVFPQGVSSKFRPAPDQYPNTVATNKAANLLVEAGEALAIRVFDNLSLAMMWRITYMTQTVSTPVTTGMLPAGVLLDPSRDPSNPSVVNAKQSISGYNFKGFQFGALYKPLPNLRLGFSYRTRVDVWGDGNTTTMLAGSKIRIPTEGGLNNPHALRGGFAFTMLNDKLLLAGDFKYLFYAEAWKQIKQVRTNPGQMAMASYTPAHWYNSWVVELGAEYKAHDIVRLRTGYTILKSATNGNYAPAFVAPPGISHVVMTGLGVKLGPSYDVDVAAGFSMLQSTVKTATEYNSGSGKYVQRGAQFSLSGSYRM